MIIPITEKLRINSDPLNWIIQVRATSKEGDLTEWGNAANFRELDNARASIEKRQYADPAPHPVDLHALDRVVARLDVAQQHLLEAFATPRPLHELAGLCVAVEAAGYRFDLSDPDCVHRQVHTKGGWHSKQYYASLGQAMVSTLQTAMRSNQGEGVPAVMRAIHETETALRAAREGLPEAYFGPIHAALASVAA